jgi:hypothetical protein
MGGQACILYGAAEFSRDTDLAVLASPANLARLRGAARLERRTLLRMARPGLESRLAAALAAEERCERRADARYWVPLKSELEGLRLERVRRAASSPQ